MVYESPKLTESAAIRAIQTPASKLGNPPTDGVDFDSIGASAYEDWE